MAAPITVLVFAQAGLYRQRERRPGAGRILASLIVVALDRARVRARHGLRLRDLRAHPDRGRRVGADDRPAARRVRVGVARGDARGGHSPAGRARRRGKEPRRPAGTRLPRPGAGSRTSSSGAVAQERYSRPAAPRRRARSSRACSTTVRPDEVILVRGATSTSGPSSRWSSRRTGRESRCGSRPTRPSSSSSAASTSRGTGAPLFELRPPVLTGWDWAVKRAFDIAVSVLVAVLLLPLWLLIALAVKLDSRGPVFFVDRRIGVGEREFGDAQVPDDGRRRRRPAAGARGRERGRGRPLQDPRRSARDAGRPCPPPSVARRDPADRATCSRER